ncbi:EndoU domain-containing protein [Streptomyces cinnamoneus]|uniref:Bacterial EndoU nuclease domain-containing protein n=1 Tax=Streptomyces cinnamoneus TaxID=53446 RepID=A0A918TL69_STRCJ|nr:EndoU domain-containing protein [Streptomyces cinnamoneus]GHC50684.1 hypothetical protein GCM10010507_28160 [Streptomyces cinnamoneus]
MIDLGKIPTFTGKLEQLETDATTLKTTAGSIRGTGKAVHDAFQKLSDVYDTPEREHLLDTTIPVRDKADAFAKKLESVSGALQGFATAARPLVQKMDRLRADADRFVKENKDDDDWQKDQKKVDENARLVREVGTTWVAFQGVERDAANKITALVGGTKFVVDDGSHKAGMYGFKESDVKDAKETPWGTVDKREYEGLRAAWEWTKDNVGGALKGFFVDGVLGTLKGLGSMVNFFDWDNFKKTWTNIGNVFGGVSAYIATPYEWALDKMFGPTDHSDTDKQKAALREFGKSLVAWDEWGKNPSRAFGTLAFNVVTLGSGTFLKLGKAGQAGKFGAGAEALTVLGKAGVLADPMSYLGKAAGVTKLKVGDFFTGLKESRAGLDDMAHNIPTKPGDIAFDPNGNLQHVRPDGKIETVTPDGKVVDQNGDPVKTPHREPHKSELDQPQVKVPEEQKVGASVGGGHTEAPASGSGSHAPGGGTGSHAPGGSASHTPGGGASHTPSGSASHTPSGGGSHTPSGGGSHTPSGGGSHTPSGGGSHTPSGGGSHTPSTGGAGHGGGGAADNAGHSGGGGAADNAGDNASGSGTHGSTDGNGSGHGSGPHDPAGSHDPSDPGSTQPDTGSGSGSGPGHGEDTSTPHQEERPGADDQPLPKGGRITEHTFDHVLKGELKYDRNGNPKVVGYHFRPNGRDLDPYNVKVPKILMRDNKTGLTVGNVWMRDPRTGEWVMKRAKTTFFPPSWTERDVRRAMTKAFENGKVVDADDFKWQGSYKGIDFEGYYDPVTGDAKTVYPLMPKPKE